MNSCGRYTTLAQMLVKFFCVNDFLTNILPILKGEDLRDLSFERINVKLRIDTISDSLSCVTKNFNAYNSARW